MTTNTVVLIIVAVIVALVLASVVAIFRYKLRAENRLLGDTSILDEMADDARAVQITTKDQAAQFDSEIEAFRTRERRKESSDSRDTADMRAQLKDRVSPTE